MLKRLDVGEQRGGSGGGAPAADSNMGPLLRSMRSGEGGGSGDGGGAPGADALAVALRTGGAPALQELGLAGLTIGEQGKERS